MNSLLKKAIVIIGGGPAAMMLACTLDPIYYDVTIIEQGKAIGRKFLVAGKGGFNLTHSEDIDTMMGSYHGPLSLMNALQTFNNEDLRNWLSAIGIKTYVGSSKRVFPLKGTKPIEVLQAIRSQLEVLNVKILTEYCWSGSMLSKNSISLKYKGEDKIISADRIVFAMGGGSWKITGSDGKWMSFFKQYEIECLSFRSSNCVLKTIWSENMKMHIGKPIKNIALNYKSQNIKGELMITAEGIEGSPAYALSYFIGENLDQDKPQIINIDFKPSLTQKKIIQRLSSNKKVSYLLKNELSLSSAAIALIKSKTTREEFNDPKLLTKKIKNLPIEIDGLGDINNAISTVGGVRSSAINDHMELVGFPNHYVIGEMVDWNAPTGGYLLQGCFSMGYALGKYLNQLEST